MSYRFMERGGLLNLRSKIGAGKFLSYFEPGVDLDKDHITRLGFRRLPPGAETGR